MKKIIGGIVLLLVIIYGAPRMNWGRITMQPGEMVTVTGEAKSVQRNQIANFSAGVQAMNLKKEAAVSEVNDKITKLIAEVKDFGIKAEDIQTQNVSIYQDQYTFKGQWVVNNSIQITLRDIARAGALTDLLNSSGATNINGPNFRMDDTAKAETDLIEAAMKDARTKAERIAKASGRKLGKVMTVNENGGGQVYPIMWAAKDSSGLGGGAPVEPGSTTVMKSITVVFELR